MWFILSWQDKSWRVRYMVANQLYELCEAVGPETSRYYFVVIHYMYLSFHHCVWCNAKTHACYLHQFSLKILTCGNFFFVLWRAELVPAYVRLLRDNEAEVRIAAAGKVTKFSRILSSELAIQNILPCVKVCISVKEILMHVSYIWRLSFVLVVWFSILNWTTFAGIVIRLFTACPLCSGFCNNGNGSSVRKGINVK
jgi:hypothetical protein